MRGIHPGTVGFVEVKQLCAFCDDSLWDPKISSGWRHKICQRAKGRFLFRRPPASGNGPDEIANCTCVCNGGDA